MSSNRITANEASNLANSSIQFDKDYIVDQIYKTVKANPKSGNAVVLFDKKLYLVWKWKQLCVTCKQMVIK